jgi:hypothetical protein
VPVFAGGGRLEHGEATSASWRLAADEESAARLRNLAKPLVLASGPA